MFYDNFARLCAEAGKSPTAAAKDLGFSNAAASHWKNGKSPTAKSLQKIADYFGVTVNDLLADPAEAPPPSKLHREPGDKIPLLSSVGARIPLEAIVTFDQDDPDAWEEISRTDDAQYFALRIRGNSMEPLIRYGEIVIVVYRLYINSLYSLHSLYKLNRNGKKAPGRASLPGDLLIDSESASEFRHKTGAPWP